MTPESDTKVSAPMFERFKAWLGRRLPTSRRVAVDAQSATGQDEIPEEDVKSVVPYDENLLERSRTQWQFGDWESLTKIDRDTLQHHPDRAKLALLAAAGHLQDGESQAARQFTRLAQDWGCSTKLISQIIISGVHNSIGRAAVIGNQQHRALQHFENAIIIGMPGSDSKLLTQARTGEQLQQLGLTSAHFFPEFAQKKIVSVSAPLSRHNTETHDLINNQTNKFERLNHEILIEEIALAKKALLAWRTLIKTSTITADNESRLASVIIPTCRPQNIDMIIKNIARQTYERLELILVPHFYSDSSLNELEEKIKILKTKLENLIVLKIDDITPLGSRLNQAIDAATGDCWAKMDDDDIYFENYLSDMIALFDLDDYAVVGKFEQFIYLSDIKKMVLRFPGWRNRLSFVSGSTFVVSRRYGGDLRFGETERGEDTALLKMAEEKKLKVYAANCFNHIVMRSSDLSDHTWQVSSDYFLKEGPVVCDGLCDEFVRV